MIFNNIKQLTVLGNGASLIATPSFSSTTWSWLLEMFDLISLLKSKQTFHFRNPEELTTLPYTIWQTRRFFFPFTFVSLPGA